MASYALDWWGQAVTNNTIRKNDFGSEDHPKVTKGRPRCTLLLPLTRRGVVEEEHSTTAFFVVPSFGWPS